MFLGDNPAPELDRERINYSEETREQVCDLARRFKELKAKNSFPAACFFGSLPPVNHANRPPEKASEEVVRFRDDFFSCFQVSGFPGYNAWFEFDRGAGVPTMTVMGQTFTQTQLLMEFVRQCEQIGAPVRVLLDLRP